MPRATKRPTLDEAMAPVEPIPLWPNGYQIPVIQLYGEPGTGKSTFLAAMRDLSPDLRIVAFDMEGSMANIGPLYDIEVVDVRQRVYDMFHKGVPVFDYTNGELYEAWLTAVKEHPGGDICINDTISRVYLGANEWTQKNPAKFNKHALAYSGKEGTIFSWGDTNLIQWPNIIEMLRTKFTTVGFLSHMKDTYEDYVDSNGKKQSRRTGKRVVRGADFTAEATLVLQLVRDPDDPGVPVNKLQTGRYGGLWARVIKDRVPHVITVTPDMLAAQRRCDPDDIDPFDPELGAKNVALLPKVLIPKPGQPYHRLIAGYMLRPQLDYGELNDLIYNPSAMSDEDRELMRLEREQAEAEKAALMLQFRTEERKKELLTELQDSGYYKTGLEVASALKALNLTYSLDQHEAVAAALVEYASNGHG